MLPKLNLFNYKPISAPEPLDAYQAMIQDSVQSYDKNLQDAGLLEIALSKIKSLPSDTEYVNAVKEKLKTSLNGLASTVQKNTRWDLAGDTLNELKTSFLSDQNLQGIQDSYAGYLSELENEQKLKLAGRTPINLNMVEWDKHKTISPNGLNIYRSNIQPKADYNSEMSEIAKTIPADINESELKKAGYDGFLLTQKVKELSQSKIDNSMPSMFETYKNSDSYTQQKLVKLKELYQQGITGEEADKLADLSIANNLRNIASLRTFKESDNSYIQDPQYKSEEGLENAMKLAKYKEDLKHSGQTVYDTTMFRENTEVVSNRGDKTRFDRVRMIGNGNVIDNLQKIVPIPTKNDLIILDDDVSGDYKIQSFKPMGITTANRTGNADWNGAWKGELVITDPDGKNKRTVNVLSKNYDKAISANFATISDVAKAIDNKDSKTSIKIKDTSGLITMRHGNDLIPISEGNIELEVIRYANGTYKIKPNHYNKTTHQYEYLPPSVLKEYGLKDSYTIEELEDRSLNNLEPFIQTLSLSDKQTSGR